MQGVQINLVSVIIPCFNVENYIKECVNSVLNQTYPSIEIICVDNGSTDNTYAILQEISDKNNAVVILSEKKKGANAARNKGLSIAKGSWIQFLDADDLLLPHKIDNQISCTQKNVDTSVVISPSIYKTVKGENKKIDVSNHVPLSIFDNRCGNTCSNLFKVDVLKKIGGWNEEIFSSQETDLMFRLYFENTNFVVCNRNETIIRERQSGQISKNHPTKRISQFFETRAHFLEKLKIFSPLVHKEYEQKFLTYLVSTLVELAKHDLELALSYYTGIIKKYNWKGYSGYGLSNLKTSLIRFFGLKFFIRLIERFG